MEKDLRNSTDPSIELQKISERIEEIERLGVEVVEKMQNVTRGSPEEEDLLITHVELTNEKDALVRRQDYFNVLADLNETKEKVASVRQQINSNSEYPVSNWFKQIISDEFAKTIEDKQKADRLMSQLTELINRELELTQELDKKIEE